MCIAEMPRKRRTFKIDERILDALAEAAREENSSANNWLESWLMRKLKTDGHLPDDFKPLGETRGGNRQDRTEGSDDGP